MKKMSKQTNALRYIRKTVRQLTVFVHELRIFSQNFDSLIKVTVAAIKTMSVEDLLSPYVNEAPPPYDEQNRYKL